MHCRCLSAQHTMRLLFCTSFSATSRSDSSYTRGHASASCSKERQRWHHSYQRLHSDDSCPVQHRQRHLVEKTFELSSSALPRTGQHRKTCSLSIAAQCLLRLLANLCTTFDLFSAERILEERCLRLHSWRFITSSVMMSTSSSDRARPSQVRYLLLAEVLR